MNVAMSIPVIGRVHSGVVGDAVRLLIRRVITRTASGSADLNEKKISPGEFTPQMIQ